MKSLLRPVSIVALRGGFGNQLFAWAYGQGLKSRGHVVLYDPGTRLGRGFALEGLIPRAAKLPLPAALWRRIRRLNSSVLKKLGVSVNLEDQRKPPFLGLVHRGLMFHWGYWQSDDYFRGSRDEITSSLTKWLDIEVGDRHNECAVHVRRGDYVSDPDAAAVMGILPLGYYRSAIDYMKTQGFREFVVYSDDRGWVEANLLPLDDSIRVAASDPCQDFENMAKSSALITANSSYSWWAGYIASASGSSVVAPKRWFADTTLDSSRIAPKSWTTL